MTLLPTFEKERLLLLQRGWRISNISVDANVARVWIPPWSNGEHRFRIDEAITMDKLNDENHEDKEEDAT